MRLLFAEDDKQVARFVIKGFREARFSIDLASDGPEALHMASTEAYDAIIMDVMLPGMNGFEVVQKMRSKGIRIPVIYLTAKDKVDEIVEGLEAGGDDYLTKPFSFIELLARVRALLRRFQKESPGHVLMWADLKVDLLSREAWRGERKLEFTGKEFDLMEYFLRNPNQVLTRTMIAEHVWDIHFDFDSNLIDVHVAHLRKKTESRGEPRLIQTVKGVGYVLRLS